jgi:SAM-dependent methyltransferase
MSRHGFEHLWGADPFIAEDKNVAAVHLRKGGLEALPDDLDLLMFNHSLEHVSDPTATLSEAAPKLAPGGVIVVRIPVAGSFADRRFASQWVALDPPRHLGIPSRRGLEVAAGRAGLQVVRVFFDSTPLQFWASQSYAADFPLSEGTPRAGCTSGDFGRKPTG